LLLALRSAAAATPPKVTFGDQDVSGSGFSPGGPVVWFASARVVSEDYYLTLARFRAVTTAAADGTASYDLGQPLPAASVWLAVDLTTGLYSLTTPSGTPPSLVNLPTLRAGSGTTSDLVEDRRQLISAVLVRPGVGAWELAVGDGGPADEDGASDGHLQFSLARMNPLVSTNTTAANSPAAPNRLAGQDLLVVFGSEHLEVSLLLPGAAQ
jgi:hypothetical protein